MSKILNCTDIERFKWGFVTVLLLVLTGCQTPDPDATVIDKTIEGTRIGDVPLKVRRAGMPLQIKERIRCETGYGHCPLPKKGPIDVVCGCTTMKGEVISGMSVHLSIADYRAWQAELEEAQQAKAAYEAIQDKQDNPDAQAKDPQTQPQE